jgi:hypothetical protein
MLAESIYDVGDFAYLKEIAARHAVEFEVIGSVPRRLLLSQVAEKYEPTSLFELCPYTSDIDLVHTGEGKQTPDIVRDIFHAMPFAEAFRWQVTTQDERKVYDDFLHHRSHRVPDCLLVLDKGGLHDPLGARLDYESGKPRFEYNEGYDGSGLPHKDLPLFAALLFLRNVFQARGWLPKMDTQLAASEIEKAVHGSVEPTMVNTLLSDRYLQNRLRYLFGGLVSAAQDSEILQQACDTSGILRFVDMLKNRRSTFGRELDQIMTARRQSKTRIVPAALPESLRTRQSQIVDWEIENAALRRIATVLGPDANLEDSDVALLISSAIPLEPGIAACSRMVSEEIHEMFHIDVPLTIEKTRLLASFPEERLGVAVCMGCVLESGEDIVFPGALFVVPSICNYRDGKRSEGGALQIRINCYGLLEHAGRLVALSGKEGQPTVRIIILRPRGSGESTEGEPQLIETVEGEQIENEMSQVFMLV